MFTLFILLDSTIYKNPEAESFGALFQEQGQGSDSAERSGGGKKENRGKSKRSAWYSDSDNDDDDKLVIIEKGSRKKKWYSSEEHSSTMRAVMEKTQEGVERRKVEGEVEAAGKAIRLRILLILKNLVVKIVRKEMGLEWMLRPDDRKDKRPAVSIDDAPPRGSKGRIEMNWLEYLVCLRLLGDKGLVVNPRELNPYLRDNGSSYPEEAADGSAGDQLLSSSVEEGGASWRLKALKRAQEQAARECRKLEEVSREYLKDVSIRNSQMRKRKVDNTLSGGKRKFHDVSAKDASLISAAASSLNKFSNDGSFMDEALWEQRNDSTVAVASSMCEGELSQQSSEPSFAIREILNEGLSANQLAVKALQLCMKGKHDEAQKLMPYVMRVLFTEKERL
ncbi:hypothetical protein CRG98_031274 [Punica granatum]|uniref:Uncharacterized protein n=1 Tax=Punica granatum TaxID=22663 RepID=A0A2I0IY19_PUNGR|nr:hypothetical protein CRG98_031274 [Punica granatum]